MLAASYGVLSVSIHASAREATWTGRREPWC